MQMAKKSQPLHIHLSKLLAVATRLQINVDKVHHARVSKWEDSYSLRSDLRGTYRSLRDTIDTVMREIVSRGITEREWRDVVSDNELLRYVQSLLQRRDEPRGVQTPREHEQAVALLPAATSRPQHQAAITNEQTKAIGDLACQVLTKIYVEKSAMLRQEAILMGATLEQFAAAAIAQLAKDHLAGNQENKDQD
jgi:hypothetical protein